MVRTSSGLTPRPMASDKTSSERARLIGLSCWKPLVSFNRPSADSRFVDILVSTESIRFGSTPLANPSLILSRIGPGGRPSDSRRSACSINLRISSADRPCAVPIWEISLTSCWDNAHVTPCPEKTEPSPQATRAIRDTWRLTLIGLADNHHPIVLPKAVIDEVIRQGGSLPFLAVNDVHEAVLTRQ